MTTPSSEAPLSNRDPEPRLPREAGRFSSYLGGRLLMAGRVSSVAGPALRLFTGVKVWQAVSGGRFGPALVEGLAAGVLSLALLPVGDEDRAPRLGHLRGE